ncbi:MAG: nucleotidyl transferase AbiEii/AbiGii toxin family protein [Elusimicrobia bacterium]|nr:nucleotidyl transferase AbiEii/AbiGii toxin family protein [Elusimicrobiota bacterium]
MNAAYVEQARIMLRVLPFVAKEGCFALKGGTAINFFVRDMPRLSVDIDLVYLPINSREEALSAISAALKRIKADALRGLGRGFSVQEGAVQGMTSKLFVKGPGGTVKVEPNFVIRGTVSVPTKRTVSKRVVETFDLSASIVTVAGADLYGGKICAALGRQHPRDLFDVKVLFENEGVTPEIRKAFIVYLAGHPRPMHEVIDPSREDIKTLFDDSFRGMTDENVTLDQLTEARERLIALLKTDITHSEKSFLVSIKTGEPDWKLIDVPGADKLPAIQWKLQNIRKMDAGKRQEQLNRLKQSLGL